MLYGLYISAGGLGVNQYRQELQANNLANSNTVGFKPDSAIVRALPLLAPTTGMERRAALVPSLAGLSGGVGTLRAVTEFTPGSLEKTGDALDLALDTGPVANGFLKVQGPGGQARLTRDGRLMMDVEGRLVTRTSNLAVLDNNGKPIVLDPNAGGVSIDQTGAISQGHDSVATLGLESFDDPHRLVKMGEGQFVAPSGAKGKAFAGNVLQGFVETSAVDPTRMLADMIDTQRAYEANANMIKYQDSTLDHAVNDIARLQ
ncbi:MAG: Flagellar basal-body rod protein FlgG [Phycisphaerae bacterium]|nr:Flagellar basal-body rod protein FlgG [Phycisphaerae bacterium]